MPCLLDEHGDAIRAMLRRDQPGLIGEAADLDAAAVRRSTGSFSLTSL